MGRKEKQMSIDDLKVFLEERNGISFNYGAIEGKTNNEFLYYLKTKETKNHVWIEIYKNQNSSNGTFNFYVMQEHDISGVWLGCTPEAVEDHLRKEFDVKPKQSQVRLF